MTDSETQQVTHREAHKKLLAEANAIIANSQLKRAERAHEKALAEANSQLKRAERREAHKKLLAEGNAIIANSQLKRADTPSAEPFLTAAQWLSVISIGGVLRPFNPTNF